MRLRAIALVILLCASLGAVDLSARPGGGETYSGRSSGGSRSAGGYGSSRDRDDDGGGGGDLALLIWLIEQGIRHPRVGGTVLVCVAAWFLFSLRHPPQRDSWDSIGAVLQQNEDAVAERLAAAPAAVAPSGPALERIGDVDPDFSPAVFEDFAFRLYAVAQRSRGEGTLDQLAPYLGPHARRALAERPPVGQPVTGVVVGLLRCAQVQLPAGDAGPDAVVTAMLDYEANYSTGAQRRFAVEQWTLQRAVSARTRPPEPGRRFPCPKCGAPWQASAAAGTQKCAFCGEVVDNGRFDWQVSTIALREERGDLPGLEADVPERGTDAPTRRDDAFQAMWHAFVADDPAVNAFTIGKRLEHVYAVLDDSWNRRDLAPARAVLSDGLTDYLQYWLDAYAQQGLHNVLEDMRLTDHTLVKLRRDRYYDALTIRLWAAGKDYVVRDADGSHVRGDKYYDRAYSEYWTLIRASGRRGAARADSTCGGCGAALTVTMAGACAHCGAHVTAGEFDWVLSKIEQDDAYRG